MFCFVIYWQWTEFARSSAPELYSITRNNFCSDYICSKYNSSKRICCFFMFCIFWTVTWSKFVHLNAEFQFGKTIFATVISTSKNVKMPSLASFCATIWHLRHSEPEMMNEVKIYDLIYDLASKFKRIKWRTPKTHLMTLDKRRLKYAIFCVGRSLSYFRICSKFSMKFFFK